MSTLKLTEEMRQALVQHPGKPLEVEDESTRQKYVIVSQDDFRKMIDAELRQQLNVELEAWEKASDDDFEAFDADLRQELQHSFDQADAGDVIEWNVTEFLARMYSQQQRKEVR
jgi:hypothetical protein